MFRCALIHKLWSWPIALLFRSFGRRFMGKAFVADDRCTACGLCATACPVKVIRMEGAPARPRWNASCASCYRCINLCPAQAIQVSAALFGIHMVLNLAITVGCLASISWLHRQLPPLPGMVSWGGAAAFALAVLAFLTMLQLTAVDGLLHGLANGKPLRRFFLISHTRAFRRYRAPGFQPGNGSALSR